MVGMGSAGMGGGLGMGGGVGTTSLDGQEVAELMIPANKVGLIIGTTLLHVAGSPSL